jgi:hypothetical protein
LVSVSGIWPEKKHSSAWSQRSFFGVSFLLDPLIGAGDIEERAFYRDNVDGLDAAAHFALRKLHNYANTENICLLFSGLTRENAKALQAANVLDENQSLCFANTAMAIEYVENQLLKPFAADEDALSAEEALAARRVVRLELGNAVLKKVICTSGKLLEFHNIYPPETFRGDDGARAPNSTGAPSVVKVTDLRALMTSKLICVQRVPEEKAKLS